VLRKLEIKLNNFYKKHLVITEGAIKYGKSRETSNTGHT
jgi:hypothetical protein